MLNAKLCRCYWSNVQVLRPESAFSATVWTQSVPPSVRPVVILSEATEGFDLVGKDLNCSRYGSQPIGRKLTLVGIAEWHAARQSSVENEKGGHGGRPVYGENEEIR